MSKRPSSPDFTAWLVLQSLETLCKEGRYPLFFHEETNVPTMKVCSQLSNRHGYQKAFRALSLKNQIRLLSLFIGYDRMRHFAARKHFIFQTITDAVENKNVKNCVILGAGIDALGYSLATKYPHVNVTEIDFPNTLRFKERVFSDAELSLPANLNTLASDLNDPLTSIIGNTENLSAENTLWLAEGVLLFLPEERISSLLEETIKISLKPIFIGSFVSDFYSGSKIPKFIQNISLRLLASSFKWESTPENTKKIIDKSGYYIDNILEYKSLQKSVYPDVDHVTSGAEHYFVAKCG